MEATVECKVDDAIDLSVDIPWTIEEMDSKEELNDEEQEVKLVGEPLRTLLFCRE